MHFADYGVMEWSIVAVIAAAVGWLAWTWLRADRARGRRRCPKCWHSMDGLPKQAFADGGGDNASVPGTPGNQTAHDGSANAAAGWTCPECGKRVTRERALFRTRRRYWRLGLALLLVGLTYYADGVHARWANESWSAFMPTLLAAALFPCDPTTADPVRAFADRVMEDRHSRGEVPVWLRRWVILRYLRFDEEAVRELIVVPRVWAYGEPIPVTLLKPDFACGLLSAELRIDFSSAVKVTADAANWEPRLARPIPPGLSCMDRSPLILPTPLGLLPEHRRGVKSTPVTVHAEVREIELYRAARSVALDSMIAVPVDQVSRELEFAFSPPTTFYDSMDRAIAAESEAMRDAALDAWLSDHIKRRASTAARFRLDLRYWNPNASRIEDDLSIAFDAVYLGPRGSPLHRQTVGPFDSLWDFWLRIHPTHATDESELAGARSSPVAYGQRIVDEAIRVVLNERSADLPLIVIVPRPDLALCDPSTSRHWEPADGAPALVIPIPGGAGNGAE
jgi:hypothetical protein